MSKNTYKKMKVKRDFVSWLAEMLPEYQHEDTSMLGDNINKCLDTKSQEFVIMVQPVTDLKPLHVNLKDPKMLVKAYFHNLVLVKILPADSSKVPHSA